MTSQWTKAGNRFYLSDTTATVPHLENAVYRLDFDIKIGVYLEKTQDSFDFPHKIYGLRSKFIERVGLAWDRTTGNLGILLNGVKGTGKTVTAKMIANQQKRPVILINNDYPGMVEFLNSIQQEVTLFFDEFEKTFKRSGDDDYSFDPSAKLLTVMDGVLSNEHRKLFILTTNKTYINENLQERPGRIRYVVPFTNLNLEQITEIVSDKLTPEAKELGLEEKTITFLSTLEVITVDVVTAVCNEVNIFLEDPEEFRNIFNVKSIKRTFNISRVDQDKEGNEVITVVYRETVLDDPDDIINEGDFITNERHLAYNYGQVENKPNYYNVESHGRNQVWYLEEATSVNPIFRGMHEYVL